MDFDEFDHETHMQRALELAREAADRGDRPYGSVLVRDNEIVAEESNRVVTEDDIRRHPELHLAYRARREFDADQRQRTVMYTSTEPCSMCAGGLRGSSLGRVTYSVAGDELTEFTGTQAPTRSAQILDATEVTGPVLNDAGRQIHREFY
jgi:Cytosine/adenosine deaminases